MKEVLVRQLKEGDVFIDGATYAVVEDAKMITISGWNYLKVKRIVGPSDDVSYTYHTTSGSSTYVKEYYIHIDRSVLLCEKEI